MKADFGTTLLVLLRRTGTSNSMLGRMVKASPTTVQSWIEGKTSPKLSTAIKIAEYFGVSMDELCGFVELTGDRALEIQQAHIENYGFTRRLEMVKDESHENVMEEFKRKIAELRED